jgi:outer membrane protein assembly factor BamD
MELLETFHMAKRTFPRIFLTWMVWVPITLSLLFGCGGQGKDLKKIEGDPEILYKQGLAQFNKRDYHEALKKFEELKSSFPDSPPYTVWAELKVGDCHFLKKEYVEAVAAYEEFKKIHPGHEEVPYVQFQIGMSYFNQMLTLDRDQTSTKKALSSFEYLIANSSPSLFTEKAREKVDVCKKRLADHEFYVGNFYYNQGSFQAAASRLEGLLEKFPKNPEEDKTLYFLGKSYLELGLWEKAEPAFRKIVAEYTGSPYHKEANSILDKGMMGMEASLRKTKASAMKDEGATIEPAKIPLIKFEEEGKQPVSLKEEKKVESRREDERSTSPAASPIPSKDKAKKQASPLPIEPAQEDRANAVPPSIEAKEAEPVLPVEPMREDRTQIVPPLPSANTASRLEVKPGEEKRGAAVPSAPASSKEKEKVKEKVPPEVKEAKLADPVDRSQPIDVTSDKVEARWKENLIIFKGNVIARQKDMVIYADSLEVTTNEDGKGIERAVAGGNVKIQQGLRVANCQKAVFYNLDQKLILTGDPKVSEGENIVLGDEIIFLIDKNRVEVKGGPSGRGKAKLQPGEIEKLK